MCPEETQVHRHDALAGGFAFCDYVESIRAHVLRLVETQIPKFHPRLPVAGTAHAHMTYTDGALPELGLAGLSSRGSAPSTCSMSDSNAPVSFDAGLRASRLAAFSRCFSTRRSSRVL